MEITNLFIPDEDAVKFPVTYCLPDAPDTAGEEEILVEHTMDVYINEILTFRVVCSPDHLPELVLGRLYTEGIIKSADEVDSIYICQFATRARVFLCNKKAQLDRQNVEEIPSCCTGNRTLNSYFADDVPPSKVKPIPWKHEWINNLACEFAQDTPLHARTQGTHSCYLAIENEILFRCEDLGRHNAFDKVVGTALLNDVDLTGAIIFTSGRIPVDMVQKAIRGRIPILVTKAVPTNVTIQMAREFNLTLICQARPDRFKIYNDPLA